MRIVSADDAVRVIRSGDTVLIGGSGGGHAIAESLIAALERRFLRDGEPHNITSLHPVGLGDRDSQGVGRLAHEGLLKRIVCGTLMDSPPVARMAAANKV